MQFAVVEHMYPPAISIEVVYSEVPKHKRSRKRILLHVHGAKEGVMKFPIDFFVEKEGVSCLYNTCVLVLASFRHSLAASQFCARCSFKYVNVVYFHSTE